MTKTARRYRLLLVSVGLVTILLSGVASRTLTVPGRSIAAPVDPRPNIVVLMTDDQTVANTYIVLTSDNGYLQGEHRVPSGKLLPYDASSRVPLIVRGPGLPAGMRSDALVGNIDLAPAILELANAEAGRLVDGRSLLPFARNPLRGSGRPLLHETGGRRFALGGEQDSADAPALDQVPNYRAVRTPRWLYAEYASGELELYDLRADPEQLHSLHADPRYRRVRTALRAVLMRLANCAGADCRAPIRP